MIDFMWLLVSMIQWDWFKLLLKGDCWRFELEHCWLSLFFGMIGRILLPLELKLIIRLIECSGSYTITLVFFIKFGYFVIFLRVKGRSMDVTVSLLCFYSKADNLILFVNSGCFTWNDLPISFLFNIWVIRLFVADRFIFCCSPFLIIILEF